MGTWGIGLYSSDTTAEVPDACEDIFSVYNINEGNKIIFEKFSSIVNQSYIDEDYASFWYALADWQWKHGILNDMVRSKALELLNSYAGLAEWKQSGRKSDFAKRKSY